MIDGYEWVRTTLILLGSVGLGICASRVARKLWPSDGDE